MKRYLRRSLKGIVSAARFLNLFQVAIYAYWIRLQYGKQIVLCCIGNIASIGGNELQFQLISGNLKRHGMTQAVLTLGGISTHNHCIQQIQKNGIKHICLGRLLIGKYLYSRLLISVMSIILRILGIKILQVFNPASAWLMSAAKKAGISVLYMETGLPLANDDFWIPLIPYIKDIDYVISVSQRSLEQLRSDYSYEGPAKVIPSIIEPPPVGCHARLPLLTECRIIYSGRMCDSKRIDLLIKAFSVVHKACPVARLTLIGEGAVRQTLEDQVSELNMKAFVSFHNWLSRDSLFDELSQADIFCLPSKMEGRPCSIMEAMSIGLAVVATDVGGVSESVIHRKTGLLVKPNDDETLAEALIELAKSPSLRLELGKQGHLHYQTCHTQQQQFAEMMDAYHALSC